MFGPKSGLRKIAAIISFTTALTLTTTLSVTAATPYSSTVNFLAKSMVDGKALDGVPAGSPEYGFTLEAMLQLKAGGRTFVQQLPAINFMLATRTQPIGSSSKGYLFNKDAAKSPKVGRIGKFLFTSEALDVSNNAIRYEIFKKLAAKINSKTGEISGTEAGVIDYAWVALGLNSYQEYTLANRVIQKMLTMQNTDGGFGETDLMTSTPDATGLALQAINYRKTFGSDSEDKKRIAAEKKAVAYLLATDVEDNHWNAYGGPSVNSTAYALMGLKAAGKKASSLAAHTEWLKNQLAPKGGFMTDWSNGVGDVFATAQALVPLLGKSYLDLLP
ncbi:MAG: hypothetical protein RI927_636 [Actinomycetota bacterium]|jgi:hypothetical protein